MGEILVCTLSESISNLYPWHILLSRYFYCMVTKLYQFICFVHCGGNDSLRPQVMQIWIEHLTLQLFCLSAGESEGKEGAAGLYVYMRPKRKS